MSSNIDLSQLITAKTRAARNAQEILSNRKTECRARIFEVCDEIAQMNMASAAAAGLLNKAQMRNYRAGLIWIADMRAASATGLWPEIPAGVADLAAQF